MKARLLSTVAASLLLTAGVATAQAPNPPQAPERAPAAQQNAPAEKVAPPLKAGEKKGPETTGQATPDSKAAQSPGMKADDKKATTGQAPSGADKAKSAADSKSDAPKGAMDSNANKTPSNAQGATSTQSSTTGQGAAAGSAKLTTEQQTKITTTFKSAKIESVPKSQINVSIAVGTKIPATVRYSPIPAEVVAVYPQWRGYYVILVDGRYVIIEPRTREIVYILV